jgi:uncharacterized protein (DUF58 family)
MKLFNANALRSITFELRRNYRRLGSGIHQGARSGIGFQPLPSREWQPGDQSNRIDWRRTAQFGKTMTKQRVQEFDANVMVLTDLSDHVNWAGAEAIDAGHNLASMASLALTQLLVWSGDSVGHCVIGRETRLGEPIRKDDAITTLRRQLEAAQPAADGVFDVELARFAARTGKRELVIVVSDFFSEGWLHPLACLAIQHDVLAVQLTDPWDFELPKVGRLKVSIDGKTITVNTNDTKTRARYHTAAIKRQEGIELDMRANDIGHIVVDSSRDLVLQLVAGIDSLNERKRS